MDRNRESRRASIVGSNGFNRRRHRTNSVRDSPDEDGGLELQESVRLRERVKKYPDRERERERDRERYRERERDLRDRSSRIKRRRAERLASHKDDTGGDDTSDESLNDDEDDEYEENVTSTIKMLSPAVGSVSNHQVHVGNHHHHNHSHSSSFSQQQHTSNSSSNILINSSHHLQHRKTFSPISSSSSAKVLRAPPVWKTGDEMISVSVPRKARSASTKRSHDWISSTSNNNSSGGVSGGADQNPAQPSSSPARPTHVSASTAPPGAADPPSPSSSNASIRKKLKHSANNTAGPKPKPPKVSALSSKPSSSNPDELEIEIAEVLYGLMTQSQGPSSSNKEEPREVNQLSIDAKSRNSSPISNSTSNNNNNNNNSMNNLHPGPNSSPLSAVAQTRKRPRQVPERSNLGARTKPETDETSDNRMLGSAGETASEVVGVNSVISQDSTKSDLELKPSADEFIESRDWVVGKEDVSSSKEQESPAVRGQDTSSRDSPSVATASSAADTPINGNLPGVGVEKEDKFEIDLMAPPPQARSSPERETNFDLSASTIVDQKPLPLNLDRDMNHVMVSKDNENDKAKSESGSLHSLNVAAEEKKSEESESNNKAIDNKGRDLDLHLDLDKPDKDVVSSSINAKDKKSQRQIQKQAQPPQVPFKVAGKEEPSSEKPGHSTSSLPLPMQSWPGGLPPMGYMAPLQGVVSMDGSSVAPAHLQPLFSQPRPKRCATHCHIARNIHCLQQFMKMNPFWPAPTGSPASLFGSKPCNFNVGPPVDLSIAARGVSSLQDNKGPGLASAPNNVSKDKSSQPASSSDSAQKKQQILIQQALPPVAPSNLVGPAFIFPLNQQQAANAGKSASTVSASNMATTSSSAPVTAMSFSYPNMSPSETTQYLAILQNNAFPPFPIPTVGAPPNYRGGAPTQPMPLFNGPFYSSQIINHHQSQQHLPPNQPQVHHNASAPNNSSSGKHMQQRPPQGGGASSLQQNSSSSHKSHASHNNLSLPIQPQNFALMTPPPVGLGAAGSNQNEKKSHQQSQHQQQILKSGVETLPPHTFAMSFGPINVTPAAGPGIDKAAVAQNQAMFQTFSDATRQSVQMMPVDAQTTQKLIRISEEGKPGNIDLPREDERKSFAFSRSTDMANGPATSCSVQGITVIDSSSASTNVGPGSTRAPRPATTNGMAAAMNVPNGHVQAQVHQHQMQQLKQQQKMAAANAVNRTKVPLTNNGTIYSEHLTPSALMGPKFQNSNSLFSQNLIQSNSPGTSPQSPQWKNSARTPASQAQGPSSIGPSGVSMHKNISHQHSRTQQPMHTQISFGGTQKQSLSSQGQQQIAPSSGNQVGSPTTSSISKGAMSGSPRTPSSASTNNKTGQGSSFPTQQTKNSPSMPNQKSPSILGNPHAAKNQLQQQQSQPKTMQQAQLFFSSPYSPSHPHHSTGSANAAVAGPSGYYMTQRRPGPDQHQRGPGGATLMSSSGVLSLCTPVSLSNTSANDPTTAIAAATCNAKGGGFQSQGMMHVSPFGTQSSAMLLPAGFSYIHPVPAGVQVKPAEQKQPAGNDNLHPWQPEKK